MEVPANEALACQAATDRSVFAFINFWMRHGFANTVNRASKHVTRCLIFITPDSRMESVRTKVTIRFLVPLLVLTLVGAEVIREGVQTLAQLNAIEKDRDVWQRPRDVLRALNLHSGASVEDIGSGAGYFTLKMARVVGSTGTILAVDTRLESLLFLFIRSHREGLGAIWIVHRDAADPHLASVGSLDAVLIANTYHELILPNRILDAARQLLRPEGRLVILDRGPESASDEAWQSGLRQHEVPSELVQRAVRSHGFNVVLTLAENSLFPGMTVFQC
jgi:SAM-dependent methyltransferase